MNSYHPLLSVYLAIAFLQKPTLQQHSHTHPKKPIMPHISSKMVVHLTIVALLVITGSLNTKYIDMETAVGTNPP